MSFYHRFPIPFIIHIICLLIFIVFPLPAQKNSLDTPNNATPPYVSEILLASPTVMIPNEIGIIIALQKNDWIYDVVSSNTLTSGDLVLASIETKQDSTLFAFYRLVEGKDTVVFKRYDSTSEVTYIYRLILVWKSEYSVSHSLLYQDDYIMITHMNMEQEVSQERVDAPIPSTQNTKEESIDNSDSVKSINLITQNNASALLEQNTIQDTISIFENNSTLLEENDTTPTEESAQEEEQDVTQLTFEEMKGYIQNNGTIHSHKEILTAITVWGESNNNVLQLASLYWKYANLRENTLITPSDINETLLIYQMIVDQFPLSYEFEDSLYRINKIKEHYLYVRE